MNIPIVYEDEYFLVIIKPSGVTVNRSQNEKGETVQDWIEDKFSIFSRFNRDSSKEDFYRRSGIVHRLDKDTSGLLIIAKNPSVFLKLQHLFASHEIDKKYYALVHGRVAADEGEINLPVGRLSSNRRKFGVILEGRPAVTYYKVIDYYSSDGRKFTFLDITPKTGRTHQIRIHLKSQGHTLVGDKLYGETKENKADLFLCSRLFLHAYYLKFLHPENHKIIEIKIELPEDLQQVLDKLT